MYKHVYNFPTKNIDFFSISFGQKLETEYYKCVSDNCVFLNAHFLDLFSRFVSSICRQSSVAGAIPAGRFLSGTKTVYRLFLALDNFFRLRKKQNNVCIKLIIKANDADICVYASGSFYKYRGKYA